MEQLGEEWTALTVALLCCAGSWIRNPLTVVLLSSESTALGQTTDPAFPRFTLRSSSHTLCVTAPMGASGSGRCIPFALDNAGRCRVLECSAYADL